MSVQPARRGPWPRGTSNSNERGNTKQRRTRRAWVLKTWAADEPFLAGYLTNGTRVTIPTCRCYRCGERLTEETLTIDRIVPGAQGGTYANNNIRPCCSRCNSEVGGAVRG